MEKISRQGLGVISGSPSLKIRLPDEEGSSKDPIRRKKIT